jgi:hypothetical protein
MSWLACHLEKSPGEILLAAFGSFPLPVAMDEGVLGTCLPLVFSIAPKMPSYKRLLHCILFACSFWMISQKCLSAAGTGNPVEVLPREHKLVSKVTVCQSHSTRPRVYGGVRASSASHAPVQCPHCMHACFKIFSI